MIVHCPGCGHEDEFDGNPAEVLNCDECGARIVHGVQVAKLSVVEHPEDARFLALVAECCKDGEQGRIAITVDRTSGGQLARDLLALCR